MYRPISLFTFCKSYRVYNALQWNVAQNTDAGSISRGMQYCDHCGVGGFERKGISRRSASHTRKSSGPSHRAATKALQIVVLVTILDQDQVVTARKPGWPVGFLLL